jgi:hypothetical protein
VARRELAGRRPATTAACSGPAALLAAGCVATAALADSPSLQAMIDEFGKPAVVLVLLERRGGRITVRTDKGIKEAWGRPGLELVDTATLAADAKKAGLGLAELRAALESHTRESRERERRLGGGTVRNAATPLANIDPKYRVRPLRGKTWTVAKLIEDAALEKSQWPDDLNRLRQREAAIRNRRIENILVDWDTRYGTMHINDIVRQTRNRLRGPRQECREIKRRRDREAKEEYQFRGCEDIEREASVNQSRELKRRLSKPFEDFEAAVKPAIRAWSERRRSSSLY